MIYNATNPEGRGSSVITQVQHKESRVYAAVNVDRLLNLMLERVYLYHHSHDLAPRYVLGDSEGRSVMESVLNGDGLKQRRHGTPAPGGTSRNRTYAQIVRPGGLGRMGRGPLEWSYLRARLAAFSAAACLSGTLCSRGP